MVVDLKDVRTEDLIIVARTWGEMQEMALDDMKSSAMIGFIMPYLPKFLEWLLSQPQFVDISQMPLEGFIRCMVNVVDLKPGPCRILVGTLEEDLKELEDHGKEEEKENQEST